MRSREIGGIGNYYGGLLVTEDGGKYRWEIEGYAGHSEEIPKYLYEALMRFQDEQDAQAQAQA